MVVGAVVVAVVVPAAAVVAGAASAGKRVAQNIWRVLWKNAIPVVQVHIVVGAKGIPFRMHWALHASPHLISLNRCT